MLSWQHTEVKASTFTVTAAGVYINLKKTNKAVGRYPIIFSEAPDTQTKFHRHGYEKVTITE